MKKKDYYKRKKGRKIVNLWRRKEKHEERDEEKLNHKQNDEWINKGENK